MSTCISCGVVQTPANTYSRSKDSFKPLALCKECDKARRTRNYRAKGSKLTIHVGKHRTHVITFPTKAQKYSFVQLRRLQIRYGLGKRDTMPSTVGQRVEELTKNVYATAYCDECFDELRYDERGFKVCCTCGLLGGWPEQPMLWEPALPDPVPRTSHHPGSQTYHYGLAEGENESVDEEETVDQYYTEAYSKVCAS